MGFSEAFPELDFYRAQGSGHRKRDNKRMERVKALVWWKVSSPCKFISVFLTEKSDTVTGYAKSDQNMILFLENRYCIIPWRGTISGVCVEGWWC